MKKTKKGRVVSAAMDKTITVTVDTQRRHPRYKKYLKQRSKFYAHDEDEEAQEGDRVLISETRPISKKKRWKLKEVLERSGGEA
ncbi:MAG: 30S ribosomal protein S17 [Candidatus Bipolaricaulota bacterium]|nr:30S ribosomal protein S17 [Candidatus Bipolaricaulota bacterium]MBS3791234.1 30S ribosomal protein S17 [Candidatus Bipolaricaulota bacterium]